MEINKNEKLLEILEGIDLDWSSPILDYQKYEEKDENSGKTTYINKSTNYKGDRKFIVMHVDNIEDYKNEKMLDTSLTLLEEVVEYVDGKFITSKIWHTNNLKYAIATELNIFD